MLLANSHREQAITKTVLFTASWKTLEVYSETDEPCDAMPPRKQFSRDALHVRMLETKNFNVSSMHELILFF